MKKLIAMLLIFVLLFAGCGSSTEEPAQKPAEESVPAAEQEAAPSEELAEVKDTLVVVPYYATESFDPYTADMDSVIICQLYDYLFQRDADGKIQPCLATGLEESEDGMSTTVFLREDVTFSDGTPFNADAVLFNFNVGLTSYYDYGAAYFASVEKIDEFTVKFNKYAAYTMTDALLTSYLPMVSPAAYEADPAAFALAPVGTGAYTLTSRDAATGYIYMTAREDYFQGKPGIQNIEVHVPLESSVSLVALENGEVDLVENPMSNSDLSIAMEEGIAVETTTGWSTKTVFLFGEPFMSDKNLAMAVTYAINKENAAISNGEMQIAVAQNLFNERVMGDLAGKVPAYQYDPDKAAEFLNASNYAGETLYIDITEDSANVAVSLQADLMAIGINAEINQLDANTYSDLFSRGEIHIAIMDQGVAAFGMEDTICNFCGGGYYQAAGLVSSTAEMDDLMAGIMAETSAEKRSDMMVELVSLMQDNGTMVPLYESVLSYAHSADLKGCEALWGATTQMYLWKCSF